MQRAIYVILTICLLALPREASAQYDVTFSHYFDLEPSFNAGAVGKEDKLNIAGTYALNFAGFENNPRTMYIGIDAPFKFLRAKHGAGLQLANDQIGLFTHQRLSVQYAYKHRLAGGMVSVGAQARLISEDFKGSKVDLAQGNDPAFATSDIKGNGIDLSAGIYYNYGSRWYVGVSAQHLNAPLIELGETNQLQIDRTYYLTGGYNIKLRNPFLTIKTSALGRTDMTAWRADVTSRLVYQNDNKLMYGGIAYSPTNSVTFLIGGKVHGIMLGYSYEVYTSAISMGNGSHELFVGYQRDINFVKKGRNLHKSVRYL